MGRKATGETPVETEEIRRLNTSLTSLGKALERATLRLHSATNEVSEINRKLSEARRDLKRAKKLLEAEAPCHVCDAPKWAACRSKDGSPLRTVFHKVRATNWTDYERRRRQRANKTIIEELARLPRSEHEAGVNPKILAARTLESEAGLLALGRSHFDALIDDLRERQLPTRRRSWGPLKRQAEAGGVAIMDAADGLTNLLRKDHEDRLTTLVDEDEDYRWTREEIERMEYGARRRRS